MYKFYIHRDSEHCAISFWIQIHHTKVLEMSIIFRSRALLLLDESLGTLFRQQRCLGQNNLTEEHILFMHQPMSGLRLDGTSNNSEDSLLFASASL